MLSFREAVDRSNIKQLMLLRPFIVDLSEEASVSSQRKRFMLKSKLPASHQFAVRSNSIHSGAFATMPGCVSTPIRSVAARRDAVGGQPLVRRSRALDRLRRQAS